MPKALTPGRFRGLKSSSLAAADVFGIIAFDQRASYRKMLPPDASYDQLVQVKTEIIGALSIDASAILTDPVYGLRPAMQMSPKSGLLLALEKSGYSGDSSYRKTELIPSWTPEKIRKSGASAVKFMVYYHPDSGELADELEALIRRVVSDCHQWDLPVFLEPMSYSLDPAVSKDSAEFADQRPAAVIETARRLSRTGADVLKMEFPLDIKFNRNQAPNGRAACSATQRGLCRALGAAERRRRLRAVQAASRGRLSNRRQRFPRRARHLEGSGKHVYVRARRLLAGHSTRSPAAIARDRRRRCPPLDRLSTPRRSLPRTGTKLTHSANGTASLR